VLLFSQSGTFGATFAITDTVPDATGPDTTGLDSDRVTPAAPMDRSFLGYIGLLPPGARRGTRRRCL
jgi:hypothetical protein